MRIFLIVIICLFSTKINAQDKCSYCYENSVNINEFYPDLFNPAIIKANNVRNLEIETYEVIGKKLYNKRFQAEYRFDECGYITSKRECKLNRIIIAYDYTLNSSGFPIKISRSYVDKTKNTVNTSTPLIIDLGYDSLNRLIKINERGFDDKNIKDVVGNYSVFLYDSLNRQIYNLEYDGFVNKDSLEKITTYSKLGSITITKYNRIPIMRIVSLFNKQQQLIKQTDYTLPTNEVIREKYFSYNNKLLVNYIRKTKISRDETFDGGNFTTEYYYLPSKLVKKIIHRYSLSTCIMIFKYY